MIATVHALYTAMWANFWTPSAPTLAAIGVHYLASQIQHERRHKQLQDQIAARQGGEQR